MITLLNKFDDNYIMKEKDVLEVASSYIKANNLDPYLKDVLFDSSISHLGHYDVNKKEIVLNGEQLFDQEYDHINDLKDIFDIDDKLRSYFFNFSILCAIYHELFHVSQFARYEMNEDKSDDIFVYLYELCALLSDDDKIGYSNETIHDLYPMEIDAKNNAALISYNLMKYTKLPKRESRLMYISYLNALISNYRKHKNKISSPIEKLARVYKTINLGEIVNLANQNKLSKIERINLGLSITSKEYEGIEKEKDKQLILLIK